MSQGLHFSHPLPRQPRRLSFVAAVFALAPLVLLTSATRESANSLPWFVPTHDLLSGFTWALSEPGRFLPRVQTLVLEGMGAGPRALPLVGLLLGAVTVMLATVAPATTRTSPQRRLAAGALLGLAPGFLLAVTMGAPVLWGLAAWTIAVRSMGPCEGRDNIQQEMSLAFGLSLLLLAEPLAWLLILPTLVGMPVLLRRGRTQATAASIALCTTPPLMMLVAVVLGLTILTESSPVPHLLRWVASFSNTDPAVPLVVIGPPLAVVVLLVALPTVVLLGLALRDPRRRHHPMGLVLGAGAPALAMALLAATGRDDAARILALYALAGQAIWLAQTPLPRRSFRWGIAFALLGLAGQFLF